MGSWEFGGVFYGVLGGENHRRALHVLDAWALLLYKELG